MKRVLLGLIALVAIVAIISHRSQASTSVDYGWTMVVSVCEADPVSDQPDVVEITFIVESSRPFGFGGDSSYPAVLLVDLGQDGEPASRLVNGCSEIRFSNVPARQCRVRNPDVALRGESGDMYVVCDYCAYDGNIVHRVDSNGMIQADLGAPGDCPVQVRNVVQMAVDESERVVCMYDQANERVQVYSIGSNQHLGTVHPDQSELLAAVANR
ncbi:MAG: hypothetical protein Q8Q20_00420 [bacterium]|nr:hypothetical protein [bacterium]